MLFSIGANSLKGKFKLPSTSLLLLAILMIRFITWSSVERGTGHQAVAPMQASGQALPNLSIIPHGL